mgnify:CR=1 FL=1
MFAALLHLSPFRDIINPLPQQRQSGLASRNLRRTSRQQCGFFHVRRHGTPYGRAVRGHLRMRRPLRPVRQPCTVPPTLIGVRERKSQPLLRRFAMTALVFQSTRFTVVDRNNQPWLRGTQIADALGYSDDKSIHRIYARHSDEFTGCMTGVVKLTTPSGEQETRIFSLRGAHLLAMLSRTPVAKEFRRWVLDILDRETAVPPAPGSPPQPAAPTSPLWPTSRHASPTSRAGSPRPRQTTAPNSTSRSPSSPSMDRSGLSSRAVFWRTPCG